MMEFKTICKDNVTGMIMVLKDTSFNNACSYLQSKLGMNDFVGCKSLADNMTKIKWKSKCFVYDENRGYLLREDV